MNFKASVLHEVARFLYEVGIALLDRAIVLNKVVNSIHDKARGLMESENNFTKKEDFFRSGSTFCK